jgi:Ubiquitin carboxyl-terminal hydrolase
MEQIRRKERNEAHLYMSVQVLLEDSFDGHQGNDLYDPDRALYRVFRIRKQTTLQELLEQLADSLVSSITILWIGLYYVCVCRSLCVDICVGYPRQMKHL